MRLVSRARVALLGVSLAIFSASPATAQDAPAPKPADEPQAAAQTAAPAAPAAPAEAPTALPTPSITGPLAAAVPITLEAGPLGKLSLNGVVSGFGVFQSNAVPGNSGAEGNLSNGQVWIQKTTGWWQFYVQAGAYDITALGSPYIQTETAMTDLYGPVPTAYFKLVPGKTTSIEFGILPTLVGAEYTFSFQNMNIERGLLWNQENAITRGVQINQAIGKYLSASFSWNDGYYSNRYSGLSGSLTFTKGPHALSFVGAGYLGQTNWTNLATPIQNNGQIYNLIYTYTKNGWVIQPYVQFNVVPTNPAIGVPQGAQAWGGAILASKTFKKGWSMAGRFEYISSNREASLPTPLNLLYGPGSAAWSLTATPTYQYQKFFTRADISFVQATSFTPGYAFGSLGTLGTQTRGVVEIGFLF